MIEAGRLELQGSNNCGAALPFAIWTILTCTAMTGMALQLDPARWFSILSGAVAVFVLLPWVIAGSLGLVCVLLAVVLVAVALLLSPGRESGVRDVLRDLFALPLAVLPGHYRALRTVRSPAVWGFASGVTLATVLLGVLLANGVVGPLARV